VVIVVMLAMVAIEGAVGAWIGSACLLAAAFTGLSQAGLEAQVAAGPALKAAERRFTQVILGLTLAAVGVAAVGQVLWRAVHGAAPSAVTLVCIAGLGAAAEAFRAVRLKRAAQTPSRPLGRRVISTLRVEAAILVAAGLIALSGWRWPDALAGALILAWSAKTAGLQLRAAWRVIGRQD